ncbi:MAG: hypothetical protein AB1758_31355, partial [Candidatus Eremiobacterota bacterium]
MPRLRHGMVLLTAILFLLVLGLLARAIVSVGPVRMRLAQQAYYDLSAGKAAEAGACYARARIRERADWRGDGNGLVVNT